MPTLRKLGREARDRLGEKILPDIQIPEVPRWAVIYRLVVPGWAQWYCDYPFRGSVFAGLFLFCLTAALLFSGTFFSSIFLGLAVAVHASSILDIVIREADGVSERLTTSFVTLMLLAVVVYFPTIWIISSVVQFIPVATVAPPLAPGDVLVASPLLVPEVGDVVVYELPRIEVRSSHRVDVWQGGRIDRILAGPGQKVSLKNGQLLIDNLPAKFPPLNPIRFFDTINVTVGPKQWFILPSTDTTAVRVPISEASLVDQNAVQSVVLYRSFPITRFGRVQSILPTQ